MKHIITAALAIGLTTTAQAVPIKGFTPEMTSEEFMAQAEALGGKQTGYRLKDSYGQSVISYDFAYCIKEEPIGSTDVMRCVEREPSVLTVGGAEIEEIQWILTHGDHLRINITPVDGHEQTLAEGVRGKYGEWDNVITNESGSGQFYRAWNSYVWYVGRNMRLEQPDSFRGLYMFLDLIKDGDSDDF